MKKNIRSAPGAVIAVFGMLWLLAFCALAQRPEMESRISRLEDKRDQFEERLAKVEAVGEQLAKSSDRNTALLYAIVGGVALLFVKEIWRGNGRRGNSQDSD